LLDSNVEANEECNSRLSVVNLSRLSIYFLSPALTQPSL
jgi:hypothetical protein